MEEDDDVFDEILQWTDAKFESMIASFDGDTVAQKEEKMRFWRKAVLKVFRSYKTATFSYDELADILLTWVGRDVLCLPAIIEESARYISKLIIIVIIIVIIIMLNCLYL